jgi:hypothetical protein
MRPQPERTGERQNLPIAGRYSPYSTITTALHSGREFIRSN